VRLIAQGRDLEISFVVSGQMDPCPCDPEIVRLLEQLAREEQVPAITIVSGAIHDTMRMAKVARPGMIFVQSKGGRSHTPAEFTSLEHASAGIQVLASALHRLAY
jgi:allantoate deiminase